MTRRPPRSTRTDTLFPYTTLFRSRGAVDGDFDGPLAPSGVLAARIGPAPRDRKSTRLNSRHSGESRMPPSARKRKSLPGKKHGTITIPERHPGEQIKKKV